MIQKEILKLFLADVEVMKATGMTQQQVETTPLSGPIHNKMAALVRDLVDVCSKQDLTPRQQASQLITRYDSLA